MPLAILGGEPVRRAFPEEPPRLTPEERAAAAAVLSAPEWSRPDEPLPETERLEAEWARIHGVSRAVAVSSGTTALTLVLRALELPPGDEVLIPAYGCPAVDVAVIAAGLTPIHVDVDPQTYCLSPGAAAAAVTSRSAAIVAVHFAGQPAHLGSIQRVAARSGLALIEDASLAPGAAYRGRAVASWGDAAVFSLGVRKPVSAGEGGLVASCDAGLAERVRRLRNLGADPETGDIRTPGGNFRLTSLQAAAALPQLARLESDRRERERAVGVLTAALAPFPAFEPLETDPHVTLHARAQFWFRYREDVGGVPRERVVEAVRSEGIPLLGGWPHPNYALAFYTPARAGGWLRERGSERPAGHYEQTCCPVAERASFGEALLLDFPILACGDEVIRDAAEALARVASGLPELRGD